MSKFCGAICDDTFSLECAGEWEAMLCLPSEEPRKMALFRGILAMIGEDGYIYDVDHIDVISRKTGIPVYQLASVFWEKDFETDETTRFVSPSGEYFLFSKNF